MGDSRKMYRVYQNLMENALKYSMAGSRVYVEVEEQDGVIRTSVKNISQCEMDFSAEEIMERFTRGQKPEYGGQRPGACHCKKLYRGLRREI